MPPEHKPGEITCARPNEAADPRTAFTVAGRRHYTSATAFRADEARALRGGRGEAEVFVHGYNTTFAEGLVRLT